MTVELRKLTLDDGRDIYDMLQEIPKEENGFMNGANGRSYDEFRQWLIRCERIAKGEGLEDWMVPQTIYWLYADGEPVGYGKLRHRLTDKLREEGGHCGYAIRPSRRGLGYGKRLLAGMVDEARAMGIDKLLVTVHNGNAASIGVALANGGVIERANEVRHYIWIDCEKAVAP